MSEQEQQPNVSPQEQQQYDQLMLAARSIIYGDPKNPQDTSAIKGTLTKLASGGDNPGATIGHTAAMIMQSINGGLQKQGKSVPDDVLFHAGMEVVADLVEISEKAKVIDPKDVEEVTKQAVFEGLKTYGQNELAQKRMAQQPQPGQPAQPGAMPTPQPTQAPAPAQPPGIIAGAQ